MKELLKKLALIIVCGTINYLLCYIVQRVFGLPIFFDTVMVMFVLFTFGLFPSIGTLIVHYIIGITREYLVYKNAPYIAFYMLSGFAIIIITWLFIRKKENLQNGVNFTFLYVLFAAISAAFASCLIGGTVNYFLIRTKTLYENWQGILLSLGNVHFNLFFSLVIGRIPITCLDRVITTFAGFGIYYLYNKLIKKEI